MSEQTNKGELASGESKQINGLNDKHGNQIGKISYNEDSKIDSVEPTEKNLENENGPTTIRTIEKTDPTGKQSKVGFKDDCDLQKIDLEKCEKESKVPKPVFYKSVRYYIMLLALFSPFVTTYSKTIINFAVTDMIDPTVKKVHATNNINNSSTDGSSMPFDLDNSCPVNDEVRARLNEDYERDVKRARSNSGEKFKWDRRRQGFLKAAFSIGHVPLQIPGSRASEIYGSYPIMSTCSFLIGLLCILAPFLAQISFYLIFLDLVILGSLGSFMTPALITLFANWLTPSEKAVTISAYLIASRLGYAASSKLSGVLIEAHLSWQYLFFTAGGFALIFSISFFSIARSRPQDHPLISNMELNYLNEKNILVREALKRAKEADLESKGEKYEMKEVTDKDQNIPSEYRQDEEKEEKTNKRAHSKAPWLAILTSVPVWAFIFTKLSTKIAGDTMAIELPTYLKSVMHYSAKANGNVNTMMYIMFCIGCFSIGFLAKAAIKRRPFGLSKTTIRKVFQGVASFGVSFILLGIAFSICDETLTQTLVMLMFFITTFGTGGEAQIPVDITQRYSGTIHAMASTVAFSGAIVPTVVGWYLGDRSADRERWQGVWLGASAISFIGGLIFIIFGDASIQPFDSIEIKEDGEKVVIDKKETNGVDNRAFEGDVNSKKAIDVGVGQPNDMIYNSHRESAQI